MTVARLLRLMGHAAALVPPREGAGDDFQADAEQQAQVDRHLADVDAANIDPDTGLAP